ncbi:MAG TPA: response regulator [Burkholderiaceae bacterium]
MNDLRILYIEDNAELREFLGVLMQGEGREIVLGASAEEALAICATREFDLVVTDVSLPGLSGTELARRLLKADPERWIALCSGYDFGSATRQLGVNVRALQKPFEIEDLDRLIDQVRAARRR